MIAIIKDEKIPAWAMLTALYVSFCMSSFMTFRGAWAAMMSGMTSPSVVLNNYIVSFLVGGLIPFGVYELLTRFVFRFAQARLGGDVEQMRYALRFFYIPANVVIFLLKLTYFAFPMLNMYGDLIFDFVVTAAFFVGYLFYIVRQIPKERIAPALYQLGGTFIIVYGFIELIAIVVEVLL